MRSCRSGAAHARWWQASHMSRTAARRGRPWPTAAARWRRVQRAARTRVLLQQRVEVARSKSCLHMEGRLASPRYSGALENLRPDAKMHYGSQRHVLQHMWKAWQVAAAPDHLLAGVLKDEGDADITLTVTLTPSP